MNLHSNRVGMTLFSRFARLSGILAILIAGTIAVLFLGSSPSAAFAMQASAARQHDFPVPEVRAVALDGPITLDGRLDEPVWRTAPAATDFRQSAPDEGAPATQRTEVRFAFDDDALYIGARMYDELGADGVRTRLARRDAYVDGDALTILFDPYHDHRTRVEFRINPSGTKDDALGPGGAGLDPSWDPIWDAATSIDSLGWTAEIRIPFSQLNFSTDSLQTWGLQILRLTSRLNELGHWSFWRQNEAGGPARYGHLEGIRIASRPRGLEVVPYIVGRTAFLSTTDPADPFRTEGAGLFSFGGLNCFFCSNVSSLSAFYSRRIGRAPEGAALARNAGAYADVPTNTAIMGAAKVTGRTADGTSVALLNAVTRRESAAVVTADGTADGTRLVQEVAPLANYFVGRLKRDYRDGDVVVGGVVSSVYRDFDDPALAGLMSRHAEVVGWTPTSGGGRGPTG